MKFCSKCGDVMVKAAFYDPEGMMPLVMEIDGAEMWACIRCSHEAMAELKRGDI